jgi:hypothetical protein
VRNWFWTKTIYRKLSEALERETAVLTTQAGSDPRWNREAHLLWRFCEVLYLRLGMGRPVGIHDTGGPTLAIDVERRILDVLRGRIKGFSDPNEIIATIKRLLKLPCVQEESRPL